MNIKAVDSGNMSNVYALNRSQKSGFTTFYSILSVRFYLCCVELSTCPFTVLNLSDPKDKASFYDQNKKIL